MKKIIINENWEEEIIEDNSNFFVLIFKQGSNAGYIKAFSPNNEEILDKYQELVSQYENTTFEVPTNILIIKVPATGQVKVMLDKALYTGEENNPEQVEILNHLLGRADCEYIGETNLETLEEAKKKKKKRKKRKTPRVTYTTGWPWYNDHMFNHHNGTCGCNKDKDEAGEDAADNANDAISGGESVGDAGSAGGEFGGDLGGGDSAGGEGGAMGESLKLKEAVDYYDQIPKMSALNSGTRGFNAKAASDEKLWVNRRVCIDYSYKVALKIIEDEMIRRGLLIKPDRLIPIFIFDPADFLFVRDTTSKKTLIDSIVSVKGAEYETAISYLLFAIINSQKTTMDWIIDWIVNYTTVTKTQIKEVLNFVLSTPELTDRLQKILDEFKTI